MKIEEARELSKKDFDSLTVLERRVVLALDVLDRLETKCLVATNEGTWVAPYQSNSPLFQSSDIKKNTPLLDAIQKAGTCKACALGGLFLARLSRKKDVLCSDTKEDSYRTATYGLDTEMVFDALLKDTLDPRTLELVETAFERGDGWHNGPGQGYDGDSNGEYGAAALTEDEWYAASNFLQGPDAMGADARLKAVMTHLIDGDGEFKLPS